MMKLLHKIIVFSLLVVTPLLYAQVDSKELQSIGEREIIFENYTGNYDYKESVSSIEGIGKRLSDGLNNDSAKKEYHYLNKYSVYHCISENEADKFNADVISIDAGARVEHIRNVRLIISSYLVNQYRYSKKDAATLAYFITIYNAVYRQDLPYFQNNFKPVVLDYITAENAGLSLKFSEWPGKSRIVIPLSKNPQKGKAGALNTSELSNKDVIDAAKVENDDMSIKERKDLVKIKEKEVKELESEIKKDKSAVEKEKAKNANDEKKLSQNKQTIKDRELWIQAEEKDIAKRKAEIAKMPDGPEKEKALTELAEREKALNEEKDAVEKEKEKLAEEEKALEAQKAETSAKEK
ncbi:MAG: P83/100 family protein, partial [Spirochaetota bacterium]|nr:P83/100 family protein [Spirochaetota bacterium]